MIKEILVKHGFRFNKQFGQNFISDVNLLGAIVSDAGAGKEDAVLEIGAGAGALTRALAERCKKVVAFEIDKNLKPVLDEVLDGYENVETVFGDIMKIPPELIDDKMAEEYKVVANLPYYITTPVIMNFVEKSTRVVSLTLMVQKEVAERLCSQPGTKDYGAVTVAVQAAANVKITRIVKRDMFFPSPNVDSAVVKIDIDKTKYFIEDYALFRKTVKCAFAMRRKTLHNNLVGAFGIGKDKADDILTKLNVSRDIRGEALGVGQFVELARVLTENGIA